MCIFFNMYDTLGEILFHTIVQKISNIQRCQMEKVWKKVIRSYSILISSFIYDTGWNAIYPWWSRGRHSKGHGVSDIISLRNTSPVISYCLSRRSWPIWYSYCWVSPKCTANLYYICLSKPQIHTLSRCSKDLR